MSLLTIGIDPGRDGGMCLLGINDILELHVIPTLKVKTSRGTFCREYDHGAIKEWLRHVRRDCLTLCAAYEVSKPHTAGRLKPKEIERLSSELVKATDRQADFPPTKRHAYLHAMFGEKIKRIEARCTGGRQGVLSAGAQAEGVTMWPIHFNWAEIPARRLYPAQWQKIALLGFSGQDVKARARQAAQSLFPEQDFMATPRSKKPHQGLVEAAMIAVAGRTLFYPEIAAMQKAREMA